MRRQTCKGLREEEHFGLGEQYFRQREQQTQRCCGRSMLGEFKEETEGQQCRWSAVSDGAEVRAEAGLEPETEPAGHHLRKDRAAGSC